MTFEDMWKSLEEKDTTGKYKQAREMAELNIEQLEFAYNNGYNQAIKDITKYVQGEKEYYEDGTMCSMSESIIGGNVCDDILKYLKELKEET